MDVGFTGTKVGMTRRQYARVEQLLDQVWAENRGTRVRVHHGDCIGADHHFHTLARRFGFYVVSHPPVVIKYRAFTRADEEREPKPYHDRNHDIVWESDRLIATSRTNGEELRSGTWSTIRFARRHDLVPDIVFPDGSLYRDESTMV